MPSYDIYKRWLGDRRYGERHRFPKWNTEPTVLQEPRLFPRVFPELTAADHARLAKRFGDKAEKMHIAHARNVSRGIAAHGRHGGQISGGFYGDWPEASKEVIRRQAHAATLLDDAARAHAKAARMRKLARDPRKPRTSAAKAEAVRHINEALRVARRAEATDVGTSPVFWQHVVRDLQRSLENFT